MTQIYFATFVEALFRSVQQQNTTPFVKNVYYAYFGIKLGDQDKAWPPRRVCHNFCVVVEAVEHWIAKSLAFGIPMVWRELKVHGKECYFCSCVDGCNIKNKLKIQFPNLPCAMRPVPHGPDVQIPLPLRLLKTK